MRNKPAVPDRISAELERIRKNVPGVRGGITASSDGILIAHDVRGLEPTQIAALVSAMHAVAARAAVSTQCGQFKEVITRGSDGYLAVYAAGSTAVVAVLGTTDLNLAMLNFQARGMIERIAEHSAQLTGRPRADTTAVPAAKPEAGQQGPGPLQPRRPRGA
jgi:predicted regulator of Ras-like GTPase activity (Roadblock/LC7/MglB family)